MDRVPPSVFCLVPIELIEDEVDLAWEVMIFYLPYPKTTIAKLEQLTVVKLFNKTEAERRKTLFYRLKELHTNL